MKTFTQTKHEVTLTRADGSTFVKPFWSSKLQTLEEVSAYFAGRFANVDALIVTAVSVTSETRKRTKAPTLKTLRKWSFDGVARATDGCKVEPDGVCPHGTKSWLLQLGMI